MERCMQAGTVPPEACRAPAAWLQRSIASQCNLEAASCRADDAFVVAVCLLTCAPVTSVSKVAHAPPNHCVEIGVRHNSHQAQELAVTGTTSRVAGFCQRVDVESAM